MLEIRNLSVSYGAHRALEDVSLDVRPGEIVVILGANGAGKSTLLRTVGGIGEGRHVGSITMNNHPVLGLRAHEIVGHGMTLVPEGRGVFGELTVLENLVLGAYPQHARKDRKANMEQVMGLFPKLAERRRQTVRTMSGGEQQMVAIGRAMMSAPTILMLDEPSLGLSPLLCKELFQGLRRIRRTGLGILLVEQNAKQSLAIADRGYLLENTRITHQDSAENLVRDPTVQKAYLGSTGETGKSPVAFARPQGPTPSDIAAEAMAGFYYKKRVEERGTRRSPKRQSADQLIGGSIKDLVRRASEHHRSPPNKS